MKKKIHNLPNTECCFISSSVIIFVCHAVLVTDIKCIQSFHSRERRYRFQQFSCIASGPSGMTAAQFANK